MTSVNQGEQNKAPPIPCPFCGRQQKMSERNPGYVVHDGFPCPLEDGSFPLETWNRRAIFPELRWLKTEYTRTAGFFCKFKMVYRKTIKLQIRALGPIWKDIPVVRIESCDDNYRAMASFEASKGDGYEIEI